MVFGKDLEILPSLCTSPHANVVVVVISHVFEHSGEYSERRQNKLPVLTLAWYLFLGVEPAERICYVTINLKQLFPSPIFALF